MAARNLGGARNGWSDRAAAGRHNAREAKVRATAPEFYDTLVYHESYTKLLLDFIFNPNWHLYRRTTRPVRNPSASIQAALEGALTSTAQPATLEPAI